MALVEPGAIATEIWRKGDESADAAIAALDPTGLALYGRHLEAGRRAGRRTARSAIPADRAAAVNEHALTAPRPRAVYAVGRDARAQALLSAALPARAFDALVARVTGVR